jgi:hypothetical protein
MVQAFIVDCMELLATGQLSMSELETNEEEIYATDPRGRMTGPF